MQFSDKTDAIFPALLAAQKAMPAVTKDATNPHFRSSYTSLPHLLENAQPVLHESGIFTLLSIVEGEAVLTAIHAESQQWAKLTIPFRVEKDTAQGTGSGLTYCRRYLTEQLCGISGQDDDGNEASKPAKPKTSTKADAETDLDKLNAYGAKFGLSPKAVKEFVESEFGPIKDLGQDKLRAICLEIKEQFTEEAA